MTDLPFSPPDTPPNLGAPRPRPCSRHRWVVTLDGIVCARCGKPHDPVKSRLGRTSRSRGNNRERELAKMLGGTKVGHFGGAADVVVNDLLVVQSKVRKAFPSWMTTELDYLPRTGGRAPVLIVTDAPGPGTRRRSIVVMHLSDFVDLHGPVPDGF